MAAEPGQIPAETIRGNTAWSTRLTFKQADGVTAADLVADGWTNWVAEWRPDRGASASITITVDASQANVGIIDLSLTKAQTAAMGGSGGWALNGDLSGDTLPVMEGAFTWEQGYVR